MASKSTCFRFVSFALNASVALILSAHAVWAQTAISTAKRDPADGCTAITVEVKSQAKNTIKDVHLCVAETNNADASTSWGDPVKDHYKEQKVVTNPPAGFTAGGIQANVGKAKTEWCAAWTSGAPLPANSTMEFSIKYCGGTGDVKKANLKNIHLTTNGGATFAPGDDIHSAEGHYPVFKTEIPRPRGSTSGRTQSQQERK